MSHHPLPPVLAFGDSVAFGQGIRHDRKFTTLIARRIFRLPFHVRGNFAHSGAVLGSEAADTEEFDDRDAVEFTSGEVPRPHPSIFRQLLAAGIDEADTGRIKPEDLAVTYPDVKVVFLNGGINNIDAFKIVKGEIGDIDNVQNIVTKHCRDGLLKIMRRARKKFPKAIFVIVGYHHLLSHRSAEKGMNKIDSFFDENVKFIRTIRRGIRTCSYFAQFSNIAKQQATDIFNRDDISNSGAGAIFVPTLHGWEHATFADQALSFGLNRLHLAGAILFIEWIFNSKWNELDNLASPMDALAASRARSCSIRHRSASTNAEKDSLRMCRFASLFHPNDANAQRVSVNALSVHNKYRNPPPFRELLRGKNLLRRALSSLGHTGTVSYRQVFASDMVNSIQINGIVLPGSNGTFPFHSLQIKFHFEDKTSKSFPLNTQLKFVRGFADADDLLFPGVKGKTTFNGDGLSIVENVDLPTLFSFFAYPTSQLFLHKVTEIHLVCSHPKEVSGIISVNIDNFSLLINGRSIPVSSAFNLRASRDGSSRRIRSGF